MKISCKYEQSSHTLTLYFPDEFDSTNQWGADQIGSQVITYEHITQDPTKTIITENLRDALVTTAKIANLAVDTEQLAELAVEAAKLAGGTEVGDAKVDDDCADDDTGDWDVALDAVNSTITFDTDHYELSSNGDEDEIFYVGSLSLTNGYTYLLSIDVKDGTESSEHIQLVNLDGTTVEEVADYTTSSSFTTVIHLFEATAGTDGVGIRVPADLAGDNIEIKNVTLYNVTSGAVTQLKVGAAAIGAGAIANAAIGTAKIAEAAIIDAKVKNLDAGKITTGYLAAARIAAGSLALVTVASDFDMDNISEGSNYKRIASTIVDNGMIYLLRLSADTTERLEITAGGVEGYANNVKNFELGSGTAYLGDQSNEHIKLSSSGMEIKDGATVLATYGASAIYLGDTSNEHISISSSGTVIKDGATVLATYGTTTTLYDTSGHDRLVLTTASIALGDQTDGYYTLISSSGVAGYANNIKTLELLTGGVAYLGDQSNEHIKLSSAGLQIKDGATVLATYGSALTIGQVAASQDNIYITSGALYLRSNTTNIVSITNAGVSSFNLLAGSDITMTGHAASPASIIFQGSTGYATLSVGADGSLHTHHHQWNADYNNTIIRTATSSDSHIVWNIEKAGTTYGIKLENTKFYCTTDSVMTLGDASYCWTDVRADAGVTACSDKRWKTILGQEPLGLEFICKLPFVEYKLNKGGKKRYGIYRGITGQELEQALIECGYDPYQFAGLKRDNIDGQEWFGIIYEQLISPMGRAIQELNNKIEDNHAIH